MTTRPAKPSPAKPGRADRLAAQLRANLSRRKQQARAANTASTPADLAADDQRASASDPSDVAAPAA